MSDYIEGRDWIGNPDGTLVYWQAEAEEAGAKLARVETLLEQAVNALRRKGDGEQLWTDAAEACIAAEDGLAVLRGAA